MGRFLPPSLVCLCLLGAVAAGEAAGMMGVVVDALAAVDVNVEVAAIVDGILHDPVKLERLPPGPAPVSVESFLTPSSLLKKA
jgi:hypothetical protein